ncbi:CRE-NFYC-1 protein [Caenorhabditis remanei]|uniref:CRE-NFYC-1 protein n=1 Tax=Caenorhabditis remanei TaxID=31234 RepID=E3NNX5_CAERE|nr:CRE-NFYC-1 protein [Caenorhabditis remanei]
MNFQKNRPNAAQKKKPQARVVQTYPHGTINDAIAPPMFATMKEMTEDFWITRKRKMEALGLEEMRTKSKNMSVPMARVKKIMKIDEDVHHVFVGSDAPIFMAQAAEFFIEEMTAMGWQHVNEARRRILQKADIATAVQKSEQFDFLIDFLPAKQAETTADFQSKRRNSVAQKAGWNSGRSLVEKPRPLPQKATPPTVVPMFQCIQNETERGTVEYQIIQTNSDLPSTSSAGGTTSSNGFVAPIPKVPARKTT